MRSELISASPQGTRFRFIFTSDSIWKFKMVQKTHWAAVFFRLPELFLKTRGFQRLIVCACEQSWVSTRISSSDFALIQALRNTAEACVSVCVLTLCLFVSRYRPRTYCLADSDEESSSAGSSDEEGSSELSNDSAGAEGWEFTVFLLWLKT